MAKKTSKIVKTADSIIPGMSRPPTEYKMSKEEKERSRQYQAEEDLRTIRRASEIRADKQRVSAVKEHLRKQQDAVGKTLK